MLLKAFFLAAALLPAARPSGAAEVPASPARTGFLVLAPDRGFLGNAEVQDAFDAFQGKSSAPAALAFASPVDMRTDLSRGVSELREKGVGEAILLPLFVCESHPLLRSSLELLSKNEIRGGMKMLAAPAFGRDPLAAAALRDRVSALTVEPGAESVLLLAQGALTPESARAMEGELAGLLKEALAGRAFADSGVLVLEVEEPLRSWKRESWARLERALSERRKRGLRPLIVLFDAAPRLDSMMAFARARAPAAAKSGALFDGTDLTPEPTLALWLRAQANRRLPLGEKDLGVVLMAHGAHLQWNRAMDDAVEGLRARWRIEPAFGMGDAAVLSRALGRLEASGARAGAVIRVFSLESSFRPETEFLLGLGAPGVAVAPGGGGEHGGHAHHGPRVRPSLLRSPLALDTVGGIEDSPLFAEVLLERAMDLSRRPESETVFLLAHGAESEADNEEWLKNLASLASQMRAMAAGKGVRFQEVKYGTWREDWPEKRRSATAAIRTEVERAGRGGRAIVLPARTLLGGPEKELLAGLEYSYDGRGFAPHLKFSEWVESQIRLSLERLNARRREGLIPLETVR